ncbi:Uncharacterised protein [Vibrio cholerae]|nr:Uncharacterised protein [Vibrio cholerae]
MHLDTFLLRLWAAKPRRSFFGASLDRNSVLLAQFAL